MSSFNDGEKVYESTDAGATWINISGSQLPNLPVNCIVFQSYTKDDLYIGTDIGVYHKDSTMNEWQLFNTGLPFVSVRELEIQYSAGKLRAATFGRGVWESDLNSFPSFVGSVNPEFIKLFPNPTEKYFTVTTPYKIENCKIELFNVTGQNVLSEKLFSERTKIDISNLSKGVYIYNILNGNKLEKSDKLLIY